MMSGKSISGYILGDILILSLLIFLCEAYIGVIPADPENPGKCVYRGDALEAGVHANLTPCQRLTCNDDGSILIEGCGKLRITNCNRGERINTGKPYPECCKLKYKCKQPDGTPYYIEKDVSAAGNKTENST